MTSKNYHKYIRFLLGTGALLFLSGAWLDASAHTYVGVDLNSFFTPWHAVLYSGYAVLAIGILLKKAPVIQFLALTGVRSLTMV